MANLKHHEKQLLEKLFGMDSGYVLDFSNRTFEEFFRNTAKIPIMSRKYEIYGTSKARRLRAFWDMEKDELVGKILLEILEYWKAQKSLGNVSKIRNEDEIHSKCIDIANTLCRTSKTKNSESISEEQFLEQKIAPIDLDKLELGSTVTSVLKERISEIQKCISKESSLAAIILIGSSLEGILLGVALKYPQDFNSSSASPRNEDGKIKKFQYWSLANFIDVAYEQGFLGLDVKKFSHVLRDFRNFIHPFEQMACKFSPDDHTAEICWQVLRAAVANLCRK